MKKVLLLALCCIASLTSTINSAKADFVAMVDADGSAVLIQGPYYQAVRTTVSGHCSSQFTTGSGSLDLHFSEVDEYGERFWAFPQSHHLSLIPMGTTITDLGESSIKFGGFWPMIDAVIVQEVNGDPYVVNTDFSAIFIPSPYS